jgi:hypothetical protein
MKAERQPDQAEAESLEAAVAQAIEACDGDLRATIRALLVANEFLEAQNLARIPARREARKIQHLFGIMVMGWRSQENYELTNKRDFNRLPLRDRRIIQRAGWVAALVIIFACIVAGHFR